MAEKDISSKKLACVAARISDDGKAENIQILNISNISVVSDYFVIASCKSATQVKGITQNLREDIKKYFSRIPTGDENDLKNRWNLLDYGDVVIHIMHEEQRETYALEKFWNHALKIDRKTWEEESEEFAKFKK